MIVHRRQERRDAQAVGIAHDQERPVVAGIGAVLLHDVLVGGQLVHQLGGDLRPEVAHVVQRVIAQAALLVDHPRHVAAGGVVNLDGHVAGGEAFPCKVGGNLLADEEGAQGIYVGVVLIINLILLRIRLKQAIEVVKVHGGELRHVFGKALDAGAVLSVDLYALRHVLRVNGLLVGGDVDSEIFHALALQIAFGPLHLRGDLL